MALQFYEKVEVLSCPKFPDRVGKFGYVLGKSYADEPRGDDPEPTEVLGYGVFFEDVEQVYSFGLDEVRGTGEVAERSKFFPSNAYVSAVPAALFASGSFPPDSGPSAVVRPDAD